MVNRLKTDNSFYKSMMVIAVPVILQNLMNIGLNMLDSIMVGQLGVNQLAGVGIANRIFFIFSMICFGIYSGSTIFISQYWGVKDMKNIQKIFGINLFLGFVLSLIVTVLAFVFAEPIILIFNKDPQVVRDGVEYLKIVCASYVFTALSTAVSFSSRAVHKLNVPTIANFIAILINAILNYVLIFGKLGFPLLGVAGAAIATVIARVIEFIILFVYIYLSKGHPLAGSLREYMSWDFKMLKETLKTSFPVIVSESSWSIGNTVYYIAYGMLGPSAIAVVQVAYIINDLFQSMFFGLGNAAAVMLGNELGQNNTKKAIDYSKIFLKLCMILNIIITIALYFSRHAVANMYNFDAETKILLERSLVVFALYMTPKMLTYLFFCGILRAGGDTKFCMYLDLVSVWFIGIPLAFFAVMILKLPLEYVLALIFSEEIFKLVIIYRRYKSGRWLNNLIN
jgi:putative MATE family efflux protein